MFLPSQEVLMHTEAMSCPCGRVILQKIHFQNVGKKKKINFSAFLVRLLVNLTYTMFLKMDSIFFSNYVNSTFGDAFFWWGEKKHKNNPHL